jgi:asparagine synthase (glutamine-hydrolysing)
MAMPLDRKIPPRSGRSKFVLKQAFSELLPKEVRKRSKMGFGVPISRWFRDELRHELRDVLLDPVCLNRGLFRPEAVRNLLDEHQSGTREHSFRLWALLMLELWFQKHV